MLKLSKKELQVIAQMLLANSGFETTIPTLVTAGGCNSCSGGCQASCGGCSQGCGSTNTCAVSLF